MYQFMCVQPQISKILQSIKDKKVVGDITVSGLKIPIKAIRTKQHGIHKLEKRPMKINRKYEIKPIVNYPSIEHQKQTMGRKQPNIHCWENCMSTYNTDKTHKSQPSQTKDINLIPQTINLLKAILRDKIYDISLNEDF